MSLRQRGGRTPIIRHVMNDEDSRKLREKLEEKAEAAAVQIDLEAARKELWEARVEAVQLLSSAEHEAEATAKTILDNATASANKVVRDGKEEAEKLLAAARLQKQLAEEKQKSVDPKLNDLARWAEKLEKREKDVTAREIKQGELAESLDATGRDLRELDAQLGEREREVLQQIQDTQKRELMIATKVSDVAHREKTLVDERKKLDRLHRELDTRTQNSTEAAKALSTQRAAYEADAKLLKEQKEDWEKRLPDLEARAAEAQRWLNDAKKKADELKDREDDVLRKERIAAGKRRDVTFAREDLDNKTRAFEATRAELLQDAERLKAVNRELKHKVADLHDKVVELERKQ